MEEEFDAIRKDRKKECASERNHIFQASKQRGLASPPPPLIYFQKVESHMVTSFFNF